MLKRKILKILQTKDSGETVLTLFPIALTAIVVLALVVMFAGWISNVDKKDAVDQIARKYMLKIETKGYLDDEDIETLTDELEDIGMTNINVTQAERNGVTYKTTTKKIFEDNKTTYGDQIYLVIVCDIPIANYSVDTSSKKGQFMSVLLQEDYITYKVIKSSTSKTISKEGLQ